MSSAIRGSDRTTQVARVATAAARCGMKLSLPKRRGNSVSRTTQNGIGSALVSRRNQHGTLRGCGIVDGADVGGFDERDVRWNHERGFDSTGFANASGHFYGVSLAEIGIVGNDREPMTTRKLQREGIAGDQRNLISGSFGERVQNVRQHGVGKFGARGLLQRLRQALLGIREVLDRNQNHSTSAVNAAGR